MHAILDQCTHKENVPIAVLGGGDLVHQNDSNISCAKLVNDIFYGKLLCYVQLHLADIGIFGLLNSLVSPAHAALLSTGSIILHGWVCSLFFKLEAHLIILSIHRWSY